MKRPACFQFRVLLILAALAGTMCSAAQVKELDHAIDHVLGSPEYRWRMPREAPVVEEETEKGLIMSFLEQVVLTIERGARWLGRKIEDALNWLGERFRSTESDGKPRDRRGRWTGFLKVAFVVTLIATVVMLVVTIVQAWRRRRVDAAAAEAESATPVDLDDDRVTADRLPVEDWLAMADGLEREGNLRHALRALFLGALAHLGRRGWVRIAPHKSNREYIRELDQRAEESVCSAFAGATRLFERSWYGDYPVTVEIVRQGQSWLRRIIHDSES